MLMQIIKDTMFLQMKQSFVRPMFRFCLIANPIVNTIFLYEMYLQKGADTFLNYVVLGAGLMGIWSCICFSSIGDINRERYSGTLALIYVAPGGFGKIIFGKVLGNTMLSLLTFVISYITACVLSAFTWGEESSGIEKFLSTIIHIENIGYFIFASVMLILTFVLISICFAFILMLSRKTELYMNLLEIPLIFICGFTFPVEVLPQWIQNISNCLAPTWAVRMLRSSQMNWESFGILCIELLVLLLLTWVLYKWVDRRIRINATLEVS
ncbi:MAG: ABC transporter permease [Agathobacter sp.]|nr:ABC transporter permease [Agathobacter sp.]